MNEIYPLHYNIYRVFDWTSLEDLIKKVYGKTPNLASFYECHNGSVVCLGEISDALPWGNEKEALAELQSWISDPNKGQYNADCDEYGVYRAGIDMNIIYWDLCSKGYIEPGTYYMHAEW